MSADSMAERNMRVARLWFEQIWSKPDPELADEIVDAAYAPEWISIPKTGPEQVKHELKYFRSVFPDLSYEVVDAVAAGENKVWLRYRGRGTMLGAAWGLKPSGQTASFEGVTIFTISDEGKIVDRWGAFCFYDLFADLGVAPPFWQLGEVLEEWQAED